MVYQLKNLIYCLELCFPYTDAIIYSDCIGNGKRNLDKSTELLNYLTICQHSIHLGIMSYLLGLGKSTVYWIFVGWKAFLKTLFNQSNFNSSEDYLLKKMPYIFVETGHGEADMVIDCTEFKFQDATILDLNSLMFSNNKNVLTGKALTGVSPHRTTLFFIALFHDSIIDSALTKKFVVFDWVEQEHKLLSDRGFLS